MQRRTQFSLPSHRWIAFCLFLLMVAPVVAQQPGSQTTRQQNPAGSQQPEILAVVNGQQIKRSDLAREAMARFGKSVTESLVNKYLISLECQKQGIQVGDADIDAEIETRARKFGMSSDRYVTLICGERNLDPAKLRNEIIWTELALRRLAAPLTQVSDQEIQERLDSEYGPKVQVRAIALDNANTAQQILAQATANPEQFSRLAINHSVDTNSASVGGLLPPLRRNMGSPELEQVAFALKVGEVSQVIQLENQFVIVKCERHYEASELGEQDLILARQRIRSELREAKLGGAAETLFRKMQDSAEIVNIVNDPELSRKMPGIAATVNGQPVSLEQIQDECLVRFGRDILQSQINRTLIMQQLEKVGESVTQEDQNREITRAAREYGIMKEDGTPDVDKWIAYITQNDPSKIEIYLQDEVWPTVAMKKIVARQVQVTDEDMQKGFESNFGPRVQVLACVLNDQKTAQHVWGLAKKNPTEKFFGELAHQYSIEAASRAHYGEVPPIPRHGGRKLLEDEAFRLRPGEISGLIPVGNTWIILWCKGRTTPVVQDFDAVRDELYRDILEKKTRLAIQNEFNRLTRESQIDNFLVGSSQPGAQAVQAQRQQLRQSQSGSARQ